MYIENDYPLDWNFANNPSLLIRCVMALCVISCINYSFMALC